MAVGDALTEAVKRGQAVTDTLREAVAEAKREEEEAASGEDTERTGGQ